MAEEAAAPRHRLDHTVELRRLRAVRAPLPEPPPARPARRAIRAPPNETGLLVHDMLRVIHDTRLVPRRRRTSPTCSPGTAPTTTTCASSSSATRSRCPSSDADGAAHEHTLARFHQLPAADVHGDRADRRGLGARRHARRARLQDRPALRTSGVADDPGRARCRRSCSTQAARERGLRLRLRYEYLQRRRRRRPRPVGARRRRPRRDRRGAARRGRAHVHQRRLAGRRRRRRLLALPRTARSAATARRPASRRGRCSSRPTTPTRDDARPVASAPMVDPRSPVVVGVGQVSQRVAAADARAPIDLLADACRLADADAGAHALAARPGRRRRRRRRSARGATPIRARCSRGSSASSRARPLVSTVGGNSPQLLVNEMAARIQRNELDVALVGGAESDAHALARAARAARRAHVGDRRRPAVRVGDRRRPARARATTKLAHSAVAPPMVYPLFETALRAAAGRTRRRAPASRERAVGAVRRGRGRQSRTRGRARVLAPRRSARSRPTTAWCASRTRSACAPTSTSTRPRRCCSAPTKRRARPACPTTAWCSCTRRPRRTTTTSSPSGGRSPTRRASRPRSATRSTPPASRSTTSRASTSTRASRRRCRSRCARSASRADDPRPLTVTGGLGFAGGPVNNYPTHAIARMVEVLRADPGELRLHDRARLVHLEARGRRLVGDAARPTASGGSTRPRARPRSTRGPAASPPGSSTATARSRRRRSRSSATARRRSASSPRSPPTGGGRWPTSATPTRSRALTTEAHEGRTVRLTNDGATNTADLAVTTGGVR